jgi:hypothetical protein
MQQPPMRPTLRKITLLVALLLIITILAACGRRSAEDEAGLPTLVPTLAVQPIPASSTATPRPEPTATLAPTPTVEPTVADVITATTEVTSTATVTVTDELTATEVLTDTTEITETESIATDEAVTETEILTATEALTGTAEMTETEELTDIEAITETEELTDTETLTATDDLSETTTITASDALTETTMAPRVFFVEPENNATLPVTSTAVIGVEGLTVEPSGAVKPGSGHLHILLDTNFIPAGDPVPKDATHIHLGTGAMTSTLVLEPGPHTLRVQFTDGAHMALDGDEYQDEIKVTVK